MIKSNLGKSTGAKALPLLTKKKKPVLAAVKNKMKKALSSKIQSGQGPVKKKKSILSYSF